MRLAMATWQERLSPVLDTATKLLLVDCDDGREVSRTRAEMDERYLPKQVNRLQDLGVEVVICGGVSRQLNDLLVGAGIEVISLVSGTCDDVLEAYLAGTLDQPRFLMPGHDQWRNRSSRGRPTLAAEGSKRCE